MRTTHIAPAKLNLFLQVTGRRADGYHLLRSLVVFTHLADTLVVTPDDQLKLDVVGEFAAPAGNTDDNLVLRAAKLLQRHTQTHEGAHLTLTKHIPVGAGLGGGSADAAAALRALNHVWRLKLSEDALLALAPELGADVAMCLYNTPLIAEGIGEIITPLPSALPSLYTVLVYPHAALASKDVYNSLAADGEAMRAVPPYSLSSSVEEIVPSLAAKSRNDLQSAAIRLLPVVAEVLLAMETALPAPALVRMTGSGSCCFALFYEENNAQRYAAVLAQQYPHWWIHAAGRIRTAAD